MSITNSITMASTGINMNNAKTNISVSLLKKSLNLKEQHISKILEMVELNNTQIDIKV